MWKFPLEERCEVPVGNHPGAFGFKRKYDYHSGVDLYCKENDLVYAVESGKVVGINYFTGPSVGLDWWNDTKYVMIEGDSGVVNYGEVEPLVDVGCEVLVGDVIAKVIPVLKEGKERLDIPGHSRSMLHIELYDYGIYQPIEKWAHYSSTIGLNDPTEFLIGTKL